jgi:hypothetical protein
MQKSLKPFLKTGFMMWSLTLGVVPKAEQGKDDALIQPHSFAVVPFGEHRPNHQPHIHGGTPFLDLDHRTFTASVGQTVSKSHSIDAWIA